MASRAQGPDLSYLPAAVDRISQTVLEARRPWQQPIDRAKLVADATHHAARTLKRLGEEPIWNGLSRQQRRWLRQLGEARVVLPPALLVELGYDREDAESLVDAVNHVLEAYARNPHQPGVGVPAEVAQRTIRELAGVTLALAEEADHGIAHRQQREDRIAGLLVFLEWVVQLLVDVTVAIAASLLVAGRQPQWASSVLQSVDELGTGLGPVGLWLLTFTVAEQGVRLTAEVAHVSAWSAAKLRTLARPDWRPLSGSGNPALIRQLEELRAEPSHVGRPAQAHADPMVIAPGGHPAAERRPPGSPSELLEDWDDLVNGPDGPTVGLHGGHLSVLDNQTPTGPTGPESPGVGPQI